MKTNPGWAAFLLFLPVALGCYITDYPVISDSRGDFSGIIRTGHPAYIKQEQVATIWDDGSDMTFSLVSQNRYGDQKIYTYNNFDPTAEVIFLDDTYCDWRFDGCPVMTAWNPHDPADDAAWDYQLDSNCSGFRSLCMLLMYSSRLGECGDHGLFWKTQAAAFEFANLAPTQWRGNQAYLMPIHQDNTHIVLTEPGGAATEAPIFGAVNALVTENLNVAVPMTPSTRYNLAWLREWVAAHGNRAALQVTYGALTVDFQIGFRQDGLAFNLQRY